jgi:hypothetical protein
MASAGMMQRWARFQASLKLGFSATVSLRALKVCRTILVSCDQ